MKVLNFPLGYEHGLTAEEIGNHFQHLSADKFHFTSKKNPFYNCMTWAVAEHTVPNDEVEEVEWMDMYFFQYAHKLELEDLDYSAKGYADCLSKFYGYILCDNGELEDGFEKIALYENNKDWTHIARQLENGNWTSKLGSFEDIEHYNLEALNGKLYGELKLYMKKKI